MTRVAAVDCGTNSIRLLVADLDPRTGTAVDLARRMEIVRLGQDVDRTGRLATDALERTLGALRGYARQIDDLGADAVRMVATSATRDAANRDEFVSGVRAVLGTDPEVISGEEEAWLSFSGATRDLQDHPAPYLVVDIGGGSTELVLGGPGGTPSASVSVDVGCVRITERHLTSDPPSPAQVAAATGEVGAALVLAAREVPLRQAATLVGLAGSVTTVCAHVLELPAYDPGRIHHAELAAEDVVRACDDLLHMTHRERRALPYMHPGRVDVIGAGALVLREVVCRVGAPRLVVSERDILDGIAWSIAVEA